MSDHKEYRVIGGPLTGQSVRLTFEQFEREPNQPPRVTLYTGGVEPGPVEYALRTFEVESDIGAFKAVFSFLFYEAGEDDWVLLDIATGVIGQTFRSLKISREVPT
jgi:hypothetical protein